MRRVTIVLDASMSVSAVLQRLARHGLWRDVTHPDAQLVIAEVAKRLSRDASLVAQRMARDVGFFGVAIRRAMAANVLWYGRRADEVLDTCLSWPRDFRLINALNLHEYESEVPQAAGAALPSGRGGLIADGGEVVFDDAIVRGPAVFVRLAGSETLMDTGISRGKPFAAPGAPSTASNLRAWPMLEAPPTVEARKVFEVTVGLSSQADGASGAAMDLPLALGVNTVDLTVALIADGFDVIGSWQRPLRADVNKLDAGRVTYQLLALDPQDDEALSSFLCN